MVIDLVTKMDPTTFQKMIDDHMIKHSRLDIKRDYLGMSAIGKCPRQVVREYMNGKSDLSLHSHQMAYAGYLFEDDVMDRLVEAGIAKTPGDSPSPQPSPAGRGSGIEVVAPFDQRLRGHVDGETVWGDLLEIKSLKTAKFERVKGSHQALMDHFAQVQLYMKYGRWQKCWIVYVCRETLEHKVIKVNYLHTQAVKYELKAQRILAHIDNGILPECECRYCKE